MRLYFIGCFFALAALALNVCPARAAQPARGMHGMVVTEQRYASEIGLHILQTGGNAVAAALQSGMLGPSSIRAAVILAVAVLC